MDYAVSSFGAKVGFHSDIKGVIIDACYLGTNLDEYGRFIGGVH